MLGLSYAEFHSLRIVKDKDIDEGKGTTEVYGTVYYFGSGDPGYVSLFKKSRENAVTIGEDGMLTLTSIRCVRAIHFELHVNLKVKGKGEEKDKDLEVGYGVHISRPLDHLEWYNHRVRTVFSGKDGYTVVNFSFLGNSVQANVDVSLTFSDNQRSHAIHGSLVARNSNYEYSNNYDVKYFQTKLFDVPESNPIELAKVPLGCGEKKIKLPMLKYFVPIPLCSNLIVKADLWDNDIESKSSSQLANFQVSFFAESDESITKCPTAVQVVEGQGVCIEVTVTMSMR